MAEFYDLEDLSDSYYVFGIYIYMKPGKYNLRDYEFQDTEFAYALEEVLQQKMLATGAAKDSNPVQTEREEKERIFLKIDLVRTKMGLPSGTFDTNTGKVIPGPPISTEYPKAYEILTTIEDTIKKLISKLEPAANWGRRESLKAKLPLPPTYQFTSENDPIVNNYFKGDGGWRIKIYIDPVPLDLESYTPNTGKFKGRGLVKIFGGEQYRQAEQMLGKTFLDFPDFVATDNETHLKGAGTDEQVENSVDVSVWYFNNKTNKDLQTMELNSGIPRQSYIDEYQRISNIINPV